MFNHEKKAKEASNYRGAYIIYGTNYTSSSAGIRAAYILAQLLTQAGCIVFITNVTSIAHDLHPIVVTNEMASYLTEKYSIPVIYPETVAGNPLQASTVIRWVLNRPGLLGGDEVYAENELVFVYSQVFAPYVKNKILGRLYVLTIDDSLFHSKQTKPLHKRSLECYYVGKSSFQIGVCDPSKTREIQRLLPERHVLAEWLRNSRVLYCFDNSTILIYEAILCGCPVVVIPDGTQTKEDYAKLELGMDGIAWGMEELEIAQKTVSLFPARYQKIKKSIGQDVEQFIFLTATQPPHADVVMLYKSFALNVTVYNTAPVCRKPLCLLDYRISTRSIFLHKIFTFLSIFLLEGSKQIFRCVNWLRGKGYHPKFFCLPPKPQLGKKGTKPL